MAAAQAQNEEYEMDEDVMEGPHAIQELEVSFSNLSIYHFPCTGPWHFCC
jgi:hypothetical protein